MEIMKCTHCNKQLSYEMHIEYSEELESYFCSPDCAIDYYFDYMISVPFLPNEKTDEDLEEKGIKVINGKLYIFTRKPCD